jgi:hypothetical protein
MSDPTIATSHRSDPFLNQRLQAVSNTNSSFYVRQEDELRLSIFTTTASLTITLNGILVGLDGATVPFAMAISPTGSGNRESVRARVGPGYVLYCIPTLTGGTPAVGDVEVLVEVLQSDSSTGPVVYQALHGSVTAKGYFPYADVANTVTVTGSITPASTVPVIVTTAIASPAAGAEWTTTVPANEVWELMSIRCQFVSSATAATRSVRFVTDDGTNIITRMGSDKSQTAGNTLLYNAFRFVNPFTPADLSNYPIPLPWIFLAAGYRIYSATGAIQATDQYSAIVISYRKYT